MPVTKVLRTQSGRVWLGRNVGIVGTPCVVRRLRLTRRTSSLKCIGRKRPYGYEAACEAMSHNDSQLAKQGKQIAGYGGDSEGDVTQCLPVKARHLRVRWSGWAR